VLAFRLPVELEPVLAYLFQPTGLWETAASSMDETRDWLETALPLAVTIERNVDEVIVNEKAELIVDLFATKLTSSR